MMHVSKRCCFRERHRQLKVQTARRSQPDFAAIHEQLRQHRHLTLQLLWEEYRQANPAQKACRDGYSALYMRAAALFRDLSIARADGSLRSLLLRFSRIDVLVIDDWAMAPLAETERRDFWEICEDRYQTRSTILTSQLPVAGWHEQIGDPTAADGILDRLVHNAHRIEMRGDSMRQKRGGTQPSS
jgi:hypothetical protein